MGINVIVVLQLPPQQSKKFKYLLNKICYSLLQDKRPVEIEPNENELCGQIVSNTVYSNINELIKLTKLEDIYRKIMTLKRNRDEHQRLKYILCPIGVLYPQLDNDNHRFNKLNHPLSNL